MIYYTGADRGSYSITTYIAMKIEGREEEEREEEYTMVG